jgi:hypothetical protein
MGKSQNTLVLAAEMNGKRGPFSLEDALQQAARFFTNYVGHGHCTPHLGTHFNDNPAR